MLHWHNFDLGRVAILGVSIVAILGLGALIFAASGFYSVAASRGHFTITRALLEFGMRRSVATHSRGITVPPLDDPDLVQLGAGHFHGACAQCHGAPGQPRSPIVRRMLPHPPDLSRHVPAWSPAELFWIVKHGLKYTGMPAWPSQQRDDEVWATVAFLLRLPEMDASRYRMLAYGNTKPQARTARELVQFGSGAEAVSTCARCHGDESSGPTSRLIPVIAGQSQPYLKSSLAHYATGRRASGIMQAVASELTSESIEELATYYARLPAARGKSPTASRAEIERGRALAHSGDRTRGVPPCLACHGKSRAAIFPGLAGQHAPYIANQLRLWRQGLRRHSTGGAIMAVIAGRLTEQQSSDVSAFFESRVADPSDAATRGVTIGHEREAQP